MATGPKWVVVTPHNRANRICAITEPRVGASHGAQDTKCVTTPDGWTK